MTMAKQAYHEPKIEEIESLIDLKKFACQKYRYLKDWYLKCLDCASFKSCSTGHQAVKLLEESTSVNAVKKSAPPDPKTDLRGYINYVFTQKEPVKELLKDALDIRPTSIYARVHLWKKNFPDLEEKYNMLEKVRFLWSKPYNSMRNEDILKKLYPESPEQDFDGKYSEYSLIEPKQEETEMKTIEDTVSLEDFLAENAAKDIPEPAVHEPDGKESGYKGTEYNVGDKVVYNGKPYTCSGEVSSEVSSEYAAGETDSERLDDILKRLRRNIAEYKKKIQDAENQISAVLTVQKLMKNGV